MNSPSESASTGRAVTARPFVLLGLVAVLLLAVPAVAQATLLPPLLTESNPASPGASTTPRIKGQVEEEVTKGVPFGSPAAFEEPFTRDAPEPNNTVRLFTESNCKGPVAATGTVEKLETEGLQIAVVAESVTTFYGIQNNATEESECSPDGFSYRQVSSAPATPAFSAVSPESPANYNFPFLIGSADPEATVSIYIAAGCGGSAVASGTGAAFAAPGIQATVGDNSETSFYAKATMAGFASACTPVPILYREVTPPPPPPPPSGGTGGSGGINAPSANPPPAPHLRTAPARIANDNTPLLSGSAPEAGTVKVYASTSCAGDPVAKVPAATFTGPGVEVTVPDNSANAFTAVSLSLSGRESVCSDPVVYLEDSTAPHTRITMGPAAKTAKRKASFRFTDTTGDPAGTYFLCKVDKAKWKQCRSPLNIRHLRPRKYTVRVRAVDPAGNAESKGALRRFRVVNHP